MMFMMCIYLSIMIVMCIYCLFTELNVTMESVPPMGAVSVRPAGQVQAVIPSVSDILS